MSTLRPLLLVAGLCAFLAFPLRVGAQSDELQKCLDGPNKLFDELMGGVTNGWVPTMVTLNRDKMGSILCEIEFKDTDDQRVLYDLLAISNHLGAGETILQCRIDKNIPAGGMRDGPGNLPRAEWRDWKFLVIDICNMTNALLP